MAGKLALSTSSFCSTVTSFSLDDYSAGATANISANITEQGYGQIASVSYVPGDGGAAVALSGTAPNFTGTYTYATPGTYSGSIVVSYVSGGPQFIQDVEVTIV